MTELPCPTPCDEDCRAACHEEHEPRNRRQHQPEDHGAGPGPAGLCECGKPASHVYAHPDSRDWACRVPVGMRYGRLVYTREELSPPPGRPTLRLVT